MKSRPIPTDAEIHAAFTQGEAAVIALFRRWAGEVEITPLPPQSSQPAPREIHQGEIYWIAVEDPDEPWAGIPHPCVVIQADVINRSRVACVVVCALTSNRNRASFPGNVLLEAGEANLPRASVVEVSKVSAVDKNRFGEFIGALTEERVSQILAGLQFLQSISR